MRRQQMVIADAPMRERELPAAAGKNLESGAKRPWSAKLKSASPPLRAPHSKVVLRYFAAMSEANRLGYRALLRFSVAVRVTAAAMRLPPEAKIRVAYF